MADRSLGAEAKRDFGILRESAKDFIDDDCPTMAAALSYYTIFSLPPLLVLILTIAGALLEPAEVERALQGQLGSLMGPEGAEGIRTILQSAEEPGGKRGVAAVIGVVTLLIGATGAFAQLQTALNRAWEVKPDPDKGGIKNFVTKRLLSFGMVLGIAFLLLVSLALTAMLTAFGDSLARMIPFIGSEAVLHVLNLVVTVAVVGLLFAAMFKYLPDAEAAWKDVWVGGLVTAVLFVIGKTLIGLYLGQSDPGKAFGAAGSLAVILVWIYYTSMILFFGAEFTQTWAERRGQGIRPEPGAVPLREPRTSGAHA